MNTKPIYDRIAEQWWVHHNSNWQGITHWIAGVQAAVYAMSGEERYSEEVQELQDDLRLLWCVGLELQYPIND